MAVIKTVETKEYMEHGKVCHYTITQYRGLATYTDKDQNNGEPFQAVIATFMDYGKQGVTRVYTSPSPPATDEEKADNLAEIGRAATEVMNRKGVEGTFRVYLDPA